MHRTRSFQAEPALLGLCVTGTAALAADGPISPAFGATIARPARRRRSAARRRRRCRSARGAERRSTRTTRWSIRRGDTPGGFCLGTGMPGSMLGSGGYPMEIVQHET